MDARKENIFIIRLVFCLTLCMVIVLLIQNMRTTYNRETDYDAMYQESFGISAEEAGIQLVRFYVGIDYTLLYDNNSKEIYVRTDENEIKFVCADVNDIIYTGYSKWSLRDKYSYFALLNNL